MPVDPKYTEKFFSLPLEEQKKEMEILLKLLEVVKFKIKHRIEMIKHQGRMWVDVKMYERLKGNAEYREDKQAFRDNQDAEKRARAEHKAASNIVQNTDLEIEKLLPRFLQYLIAEDTEEAKQKDKQDAN